MSRGPLASMTGYARATGAVSGARFSCDIRSVNGRGLDIRTRLPAGFEPLESELRRLVGAVLARGSVTLSLACEFESAEGEVYVNQSALGVVLDVITMLTQKHHVSPPTADGILALKGVLEQRQTTMSPAAEEVLHTSILDAVATALDDLVAFRHREGEAIRAVLAERLDHIESLVLKAENHPTRSRDAIREKLRQQLALLAGNIEIDPDRLAQEALILATKADIREELDRLTAHIANARTLLTAGSPAGRKLDFLTQEFNREANTLCAKSNSVELTAIGLDLKAAIDQLREQVQNIE